MQIIGIIISLIIAGIFGFGLMKSEWINRSGFIKWVLIAALVMKVIGTYFQQALYTYYYTDRSTADIYRFFDDGVLLKEVFFFKSKSDFFSIMFNIRTDNTHFHHSYFEKMNAWIKPFESGFYNDNHIMIKLNALFNFISFDQYEVNGILFSLLGFTGLLALITSLIEKSNFRNLALILTCLFPSSLLWLVGGLKETLLIAALGGLIFSYFNIAINGYYKPKILVLAFLSLVVLASVKVYFLMAIIPALIIHYVYVRFKLSAFAGIATWIAVIAIGFIGTKTIDFDSIGYISAKQTDFINHMDETKAGSAFKMETMEPTLIGLLKYSPVALSNSLLKPIFPSSFAEMLMLLENIVFWAVVLLALLSLKNASVSKTHWIWLVPFSLALLILIGTTTPVLGAIMRYRAPIILLLIIAITPYLPSQLTKYFA
ncbi:MAG: hypothetical protein NWQ55_12385 [Salibacteraceae bacterium]|nr:hypothetical protein [Salibacteraceae bacterium]MDP4762141.1 hypothetical protein [Salibacteraceae bacterium]MDP4965868.1 hypothetical protein [Salibacteraceae bacterium]